MAPGGTTDGFVNNDDFSTDMGPPDMVPRKMFGEPCNDKSECETEICIFTGLGGICSRLCPPACPGGFGCFGVLGGGIDPGAVVDVCVPITTQLCTPCMAASECSAGGKDLCLPASTGGTFCGRDCSTIACPMGYSCQNITQGGNMFKQCVPNSGSCDCNSPANMGLTQSCQITTPFGMCTGSRTCNGASGWGACAPPSPTDVPDGNFVDDNCDGIDGDINAGIFVAKGGVDNSTCGLTTATPCLSINGGILRASDESKKYVYVQAGDYTEVVVMLSGKHVYGGFNNMWKRASRTTSGHLVRIIGGFDSSEAQYMAVRAHNLAGLTPTTLADVEIVGPNPPAAQAGRTSYGVHAYRALLALDRVTVIAGNGTTGSTGGTGSNASASSAAGGAGGGNAHYSEGETCGSVSGASVAGGGGGGGTNNCNNGGRNANAGGGGKGGTRDTSCGSCGGVCSLGGICGGNCNARAGENGTAASDTNGNTAGGAGSLGGTCAIGNGGGPGHVSNGAGGTRGATRGVMVLSNKYWSATSGNAGSIGDNGTGGGGGGGSGGCDDGLIGDSYGAGGGGGGAGGCRASSGGGGGGGGGGSFAIFATDTSTVTVTGSDIQRGNGGDGGSGGQGGRGQPHGSGNTGGQGAGNSKTGGSGGNGGHGGHSGGGAGGSGGVSAAYFSFSSTITVSTTTATGGSAGAAGPSGPIPSSSYGDGNAGQTGAAGSLQTTGNFVCAASGGC
jgi:hypothetical protein